MPLVQDITEGLRNKRSQRKGRGESSGRGKTSGRGNKGSKARNGKYIRRGYEGGQTEIYRRFPKRGFNNVNFETKYHVVNLSDLEVFDDGATVDAAALIEKGLVPDTKQGVKILGNGKLTKKLTINAGWYSKSAHEAVTTAGGTANTAKGETFEFPKPKKKFVKREKPEARRRVKTVLSRRCTPMNADRTNPFCSYPRSSASICGIDPLGHLVRSPAGGDNRRPVFLEGVHVQIVDQRVPRAGTAEQDPVHAIDAGHLPHRPRRAGAGAGPGSHRQDDREAEPGNGTRPGRGWPRTCRCSAAAVSATARCSVLA